MKIIVDAMGGDNAPAEIVAGTLEAVREFGIEAILVGKSAEIRACMGGDVAGVSILDAPEIFGMEDDPTTLVRAKKDTSMAVALRALAADEGDALVSAGNTGALLVGATMIVKRIPGVRRAALSPVLPTAKGGALLIDCGANVECTPEYLLQFGKMGACYAKHVMKINNPRVGLVNNGTEEHKGTQLCRDAHELLKTAPINFIGNIEGRDVALGGADVVVTDGFTGNVLLKTIEGVGLFFSSELKNIFMKNLKSKIAALLVKDGIRGFKKKMDYNETGGAPLLGIAKPVIKAHGSAKSHTFRSAIEQAIAYVDTDIISKIRESVEGDK
ncbi:MAG: phosphate acyltransferase PlsX [Clostridia bacterium]